MVVDDRVLSRRRFLQRAGAVGAGALAAHAVPGVLAGVRAAEPPPTRGERLDGGLPVQAAAQSVDGAPRSEPVAAPFAFSLIGFELPDGAPVRFRTSLDGREWSAWSTAPPLDALGECPDEDSGEPDGEDWRRMTPPVWVGEARWLQVEGPDPAAVVPHVIDSAGLSEPLPARAIGALLGDGLVGVAAASTADVPAWTGIPRIVTRVEWGADESLRRGSASHAHFPQLGVVHHTAGSNAYAAAEAAAVVRGIYRYHTQSLGWSDIGYNFLVDRYGRIYEGRAGGIDRGVIGAHAQGFNTGSVGVAIMGMFTSAAVPAAAEDAVLRVLSWKYRLHRIPASGTVRVTSAGSQRYPAGTVVTLARLSGHRDTQSTACPGDVLYNRLGTLRHRLADSVTLAEAQTNRSCRADGTPTAGTVQRAAGGNRITTAVAASAAHWQSASTALLASSRDFPDALAGVALAARGDAPLLLTEPGGLPRAVAGELRRLGVARVILLGGQAALSPVVEQAVRSLGVPAVERLAGSNRFHTAALIARRAGIGARGEVALALGDHSDRARAWPDALAAGALAGLPDRVPVLLTLRDRVPAPTEQALAVLGARTVLVVGGTGAITGQVVSRLRGLGYGVRRLAGPTRYATSVEVARFARARWGRRTPLVVASGADFPDALPAGAVAARRRCPLLLVPPCGLDEALAVGSYLGLRNHYQGGVILGGTAAVSDRVRWQLNQVIG